MSCRIRRRSGNIVGRRIVRKGSRSRRRRVSNCRMVSRITDAKSRHRKPKIEKPNSMSGLRSGSHESRSLPDELITERIRSLLMAVQEAQGTDAKEKIALVLMKYLAYNLAFLRAHPKFAAVAQQKIKDLADEGIPWSGDMYLKIFGVEIPSNDMRSDPVREDTNMDVLQLFESLHMDWVSNDLVLSISPSIGMTVDIFNKSKEHQAYVRINLEYFKSPDWLGPKGVLSRINFFRVEEKFRGKGKCSQIFGFLLQYLITLGVNVVSLVIGSSTEEKACKCYIRAASENGFYPIDPNVDKNCQNGTELLFTRERSPYERFFVDGTLTHALEEFPMLVKILENYRTRGPMNIVD